MKEILPDRIKTLQDLSGLPVVAYKEMGVTCFVFGDPSRPFKTTFTYPKAKLFAEGIALGREMK